VVGGVQTRQDFGGVQAGGFCQGARDHFERLGVFPNGVLCKVRRLISKRGNALDELHFRCTCAGDKFRISGDGFDNVDAVVDGALDVVEVILGRASDDERGGAGRVVFLSEDRYAVATDFEGFHDVDVTHFIRHGGAEAGERGSADDAAEAAELEFGEDFDDEEAETVKVVHR